MQGLPSRQALKIFQKPVHLVVDTGILLVGAEVIFPLSPQRVHRVQFRTALRQPEQIDVLTPSQGHRILGRVARILVQQQAVFG